MAWPSERYFTKLIGLAQQTLSAVQIKRNDIGEKRAILDFEGQ